MQNHECVSSNTLKGNDGEVWNLRWEKNYRIMMQQQWQKEPVMEDKVQDGYQPLERTGAMIVLSPSSCFCVHFSCRGKGGWTGTQDPRTPTPRREENDLIKSTCVHQHKYNLAFSTFYSEIGFL